MVSVCGVCVCTVCIAYLSQFFIEVRCVNLSPLSQLLVKHVIIPHDEVGPQELLHLHGNVHGDWDDVVKQHHEGQEVCERPDHLREREEKMEGGVEAGRRRM